MSDQSSMLKSLLQILKTLLVFTVVVFIVWVTWSFQNGSFSIFNRTEISNSFSQFVSLEGTDEYVIAKLTTDETLNRHEYKALFGFPVGDTLVSLSLLANYKYYVKLAELTQTLEDETLYIQAPGLYLSKPVAIELSTVRVDEQVLAFGPDQQELINAIYQDASTELAFKGRLHTAVVYDKAAKALAENFNNYFKSNNMHTYYKDIAIIFSSEQQQTIRRFMFNKGLCDPMPCILQFDLGGGNVFMAR